MFVEQFMKKIILGLCVAASLTACDNHQPQYIATQQPQYMAPQPVVVQQQPQYIAPQPVIIQQQSNSGDVALGMLAGAAMASMIHGSNGRDYYSDHGRYYYMDHGHRAYDANPPSNVRNVTINKTIVVNNHPAPNVLAPVASAAPTRTIGTFKPVAAKPIAAPVATRSISTFKPVSARHH